LPLVTEIQVAGVEEARRELIHYFRAYKSGTQDIKELNKAMREIAQPIRGARRAFSLLRTEFQLSHQVMFETARLMRDIGRIGRTATNMFTAYTVAQIRLAQAQRDYTEATKDVEEAQKRYNQYLKDFGADCIYTIQAYEELQRAIERQKQAEEELQRTQQATIMGYVGIGLQIGELIATVPTMIKHVNDLKIALSTANISASTFAAALGTIGAALAGIFLGIEAANALCEAFGSIGAIASIVIGVLTSIAAITAAIALNVSIASAGFAALAGVAAFGAAMAIQGGYRAATSETQPTETTAPEMPIAGERQYGGIIPETGLYMLHAGEHVTPANKAIERSAPKMIQIRNTFYINNISSEIDIEELSERVSARTFEKLGEIQ